MDEITPLTLWTHHPMSKGGKLAGMWSWGNTSPLNNPFCIHKCSFQKHCYGYRYCMIRPNVNQKYTRNGEILKLPMRENLLNWAPLGSHRIQSFGEIFNDSHWRNIVLLCENNPQSKFTIWTKRTKLIEDSVWQNPENLQIIASSAWLSNEPTEEYPTFLVSKEPPKGEFVECKGKCILCNYCYGWNRYAGLDPEIPIWERPK